MNEKLKYALFFGIFVTLFLCTITIGFDKPTHKNIDCYDRYGNIIKDLVCEDINKHPNILCYIFLGLTVIIVILFIYFEFVRYLI